MNGSHKHRCFECNYIWQHDDTCAGSSEDDYAVEAHTCPRCSVTLPDPWPHYRGPRKATEVRSCATNGMRELQDLMLLLGVE